MSIIERPPVVDPDLLSRAVAMTGASSDTEAINLALQRLVEQKQKTVTVDMLVDDGEFLMVPGVPGHVITTQMVEDALNDDCSP